MADQPDNLRGPRIFGYLGVPEAERVPEEAMDALAARVRASLLAYSATSPILALFV
jgi:hypothetical protein